MPKKKNKVTYGLKNVTIWPITSTDDNGKPTYGTSFKQPGAVDLTIDPEGTSDKHYGDDTVYWIGNSNNGYSGKLSVYDPVEEFHTEILGETRDTNGAMIENSDAEMKEFAMAFEFKGDASKRRHLLYRCSASRPSVGSKTQGENKEPNNTELNFQSAPRIDNGNVKARAEEEDAAYANWYGTTPYETTTTAEG